MIRWAIVIPVFNHEHTITKVIQEALQFHVPVFVVDDGSTDGIYNRIKDINAITIIQHSANMGKGAALLTGFRAATNYADWVVTIDADGQHRPKDALNLLQSIPNGMRSIVVGRRVGMDESHVPRKSRFGRKFSNFWVRAAGGPKISDTQSGMRLYPLPEVLILPVKARRFQFEVEVLVKASWFGLPVFECPIQVKYPLKGKRLSHYRGFVDFVRNALTFTRLILGRCFVMPCLRLRDNKILRNKKNQ
jgi:glycosyltransferase involved in cell wall biosynthesis